MGTAMECLEILSSFFKYLSAKSFLKLELSFELSEETNISEADKVILENIKQCLVKSNFYTTRNGLNNVIEKNQVKEKIVKSSIICEICKKKFAHPKILDFHFGVCHSQNLEDTEKRDTEENQQQRKTSQEDLFCCIGCNKCFPTKINFENHSGCGEKFSIPHDLVKYHQKFECGVCHENFKQISRIQFHPKSCVQGSQYNCNYCNPEV